MAFVQRRVSDLSGKEAADSEFVTLVVREHPKLDAAVQLDVLPDEIANLKSAGEIVVLEVKNGETKNLVVTLAEFNKLHKEIDKIIENAPGLRGRRPGYSPGSRG
ncbi:hypothetical protein [Streptomyces turgidiscabies]|uniref:hypothetical protein n=1 Tax=Streptomyces turgidiscabies TaxID=85558 RepID=UPI0038F7C44E